jgi:hypothetical protein
MLGILEHGLTDHNSEDWRMLEDFPNYRKVKVLELGKPSWSLSQLHLKDIDPISQEEKVVRFTMSPAVPVNELEPDRVLKLCLRFNFR